MIDPMHPDEQAFERLLMPGGEASPQALRTALRLQTTGILRRRRRLKRLGTITVLAGCYAAGLFTFLFWLPQPAERERQVAIANVVEEPVAALSTPDKVPPILLEYQAPLAAKEDRSRLYREAGDLHASENNNWNAALRCYRESLNEAPADTEISTGDNFLLMALKDARQKEKRHASSHD